jgi:hypothetical protein
MIHSDKKKYVKILKIKQCMLPKNLEIKTDLIMNNKNLSHKQEILRTNMEFNKLEGNAEKGKKYRKETSCQSVEQQIIGVDKAIRRRKAENKHIGSTNA